MEKRGWIRIIEAVFAIMLVAGVLLILISQFFSVEDISEEVFNFENAVLRSIELNDSFRDDILGVEASNLPVEWDNFESENLGFVKDYIVLRVPSHLECNAVLCEGNSVCQMGEDINEDIYAKAVLISAESEVFEIRQLKLFCWPA